MPDHSKTKTSKWKPAGTPLQDPLSPNTPKCFQDILEVVYTISDEQWTAWVGLVPTVTKKQHFASQCTETVITVAKLGVKNYLPTAISVLGLDAVYMAEEQLQKKLDHFSMDPSGTPGTAEASTQRSRVIPADLLCKLMEDFVHVVQVAMQTAISKVASSKESSFPINWTEACCSVADEMFKILQDKKELARPSDVSRDSKTLVAPGNSVSLIDDLSFSCTNDVIDGILRLCQSYIFLGTSELSAVSTLRLYEVMQNLEKFVSTSRRFYESSMKGSKLEESEGVSFPASVSGVEEDGALGLDFLSHHTERLFSDGFHVMVMQAVCDALFKKISESVRSIKTSNVMMSKSVPHPSVEKVNMLESINLPPSFLLESFGLHITTTFLNNLERVSSSHVDCGRMTELNFITTAHRIYRNVHYEVFMFLLRLQEAHPAEDVSFQYPSTSSQYQESDSDKKQIQQQISAESIHCHADRLISLTSDVLQSMARARLVRTAFSDSLPDTSDFEASNASAKKPPSALSQFYKALKNVWKKHLCSTRNSVDVMKDPQASFKTSEHAKISNDKKSTGASPSDTSRPGSVTVRETWENFTVSTEKVDSYSARPLNDFPSGAESMMEKKMGRSFRYIVTENVPLIKTGYKTSSASLTPSSEPGILTVEDVLVSLDSELYSDSSRSETKGFKKTRQRLSMKFAAIRKVLYKRFKRRVHPA